MMKITKQLTSWLAVLMLTLFMASCSKSAPELVPELSLSTAGDLSFAGNSSSSSFRIVSNTDWVIATSQPWCTVNPASGNGNANISLSIAKNNALEQRSASVTVTAGSLSKNFNVIQAAGDSLNIAVSEYNLAQAGGEITVSFLTSGNYTVTVNDSWITKNAAKSLSNKSESFTIAPNKSIFKRNGTITFTTGVTSKTVSVSQTGLSLTIADDITGVPSDAKTLVSKMKLGWNLGNSLEAPSSETAWGNPATTQQFITSVKNAGFNAIRIPCAWNSYVANEATLQIKESWLNRVKEVVDYCYANDMYVIINIHWDGGWLENNPFYAKQEIVNNKQRIFWEQIAVNFRDYDEHLLFAGTNEVHADYGTPTTEHITVQQSFNQTFVNTVRSTGGKNGYRNLIVQTYNTNIDHGVNFMTMPIDKVPDRLIVEVHYYDPWDFAGQEDSGYKTQWGAGYTDVSTWGQEDYLINQFKKVKTKFIDKNIPVILGEYGATRRSNLTGEALTKHIESRNYYLKTVTATAVANGIVPFIWDNGATGNNGMGIFNRNNGNVVYPDMLQAIKEGAVK